MGAGAGADPRCCLPQRLRAQAEGHQPFFSTLEADLSKAKDVNERMVRGHSERDVDLDRYRERVQQLLERWQAVLTQTDLRQRELDQLGRQLRYYRESCDGLLRWIQDAKQRQEKIQAVPVTDSQTVREQLLQEKVAPAARRAGGGPARSAIPGRSGVATGRLSSPRRVSPETAGGVRPQQGEGGGVPALRQAVHRRHQGALRAPGGSSGQTGAGDGGRQPRRGLGGLAADAGGRAEDPSGRQDYELQLVTFKAQVEPMASPAKKPKVQSASDSIIQEVRGMPRSRRSSFPRSGVGTAGLACRLAAVRPYRRGAGQPGLTFAVCRSTWTCGRGTAS